MKKLFAILAVSAFLFASCGDTAKKENAENKDTTATAAAKVDTAATPQIDTTDMANLEEMETEGEEMENEAPAA
ncbi:MAG: hypothetical protein J5642_03375 [Bacteroidales bacterium]|nr:hypothetical protein [Bacteroidales bacterium]